ncbi:tRNA pseudouridine(55) synthase TruB [Aquihabitans sp. McL0605]|uniref:tRNA pseudouridine(55) synthase TruB n=1 Tax=Aquihabitans sp. McL0605 TaxID=3415671 RepID=UPI003CEBA0F9
MGRRGGSHDGPDGLVVVDKPTGWTSHDVVAKSRGLLGTRKVGHAGTLDPDATGVLLLGVGTATKLLRFLSPLGKAYVGEVRLGVDTSTLDASGEVTAVHDMRSVALDDVRGVLARFRGPIEQIPPMVSAVKIDGKRLHELAREGKEVDRAPRPVTIHALEVGPADAPIDDIDVSALERIGGEPTPEWQAAADGGAGISFAIAVTCSSGTYIRTLAQDIGVALGGGAHLVSLRRTSVGPYTLADSVRLESITPESPLPVADAVRHLARVTVDAERASDIAVGKVLEREVLGLDPSSTGEWAVFSEAGKLLAVYEPFRGSTVKPSLVIPT